MSQPVAPVDLETAPLVELIRLRERLSETLLRRFERHLAVAFSDVTGSTAYFAQHGDEAGRGLQQRHLDALEQVVPRHRGRIVDTAGDGALLAFFDGQAAISAMVELLELTGAQNATRPPEYQLTLRVGIHAGSVLTDDAVVSGDAVNLCSRVTSSAEPGEIRVTRAAFLEFSTPNRLRCRPLPPVVLKGIGKPTELYVFHWREHGVVPAAVRIAETGEIVRLPDQQIISFGRLREHEGTRANDVVLDLPDKTDVRRISRWHFELRRHPEGLDLVPLSDHGTEVDGRPLARGERAPVRRGTVVRLAGVMTLTFLADARDPRSPDDDVHETVAVALPLRPQGSS